MNAMNNRRQFLKKISLGSMLTVNIPNIVSAAYSPERTKKIHLQKEDIILFQGDSITDAHRKKDDLSPNSPAALGSGYPILTAAGLLKKYPEKNLHIYNKGISGNKVYQLAERWDADCLDIKPAVLSILVGVNDFWHTLVNGYKGTLKTYQDDYKTLLDRTKQTLPEVKLIIGEPYAIIGVKSVDAGWYPAFNDYRHAAREIAESYGAVFIPYQNIYEKALQSAPGSYWTLDGVHPSLAGAELMAQAWMMAVG
jgi:lysophospholipase L1-like esterase